MTSSVRYSPPTITPAIILNVYFLPSTNGYRKFLILFIHPTCVLPNLVLQSVPIRFAGCSIFKLYMSSKRTTGPSSVGSCLSADSAAGLPHCGLALLASGNSIFRGRGYCVVSIVQTLPPKSENCCWYTSFGLRSASSVAGKQKDPHSDSCLLIIFPSVSIDDKVPPPEVGLGSGSKD